MSNNKVMNRWYVVIGAILIQLCLGAIYAWSVFTPKLTMPIEKGGTYGFSATQAAWVFSVGLLVFSVVMIISGRMISKTGLENSHLLAELFSASGIFSAVYLDIRFPPS